MSLLSSIGGIPSFTDEDNHHNMLQDLQLAAELGKTLLERNKELENIIKLQQSTVEEQAQEIEYMKKQTAALREVNDSRLKIYEQLEVSIQDLERANHRLVIENTSDKKLIKSQCTTIETLEAKCEELQKKIDELHELDELRLQQQNTNQLKNTAQTQTLWKASVTPGGDTQENATTSEKEMMDLLVQLQTARNQRAREQKKATDLGQQLATLIQENTALEEQITILNRKAQHVKNLQEEINALEEVRRGNLCGRCLRGMETKTHDEISILDLEECDVMSTAESLISENQRDTESITQDLNPEDSNSISLKNPYKVLVEKYQALLEVQRRPMPWQKKGMPPMSLQEEFEMSGEFNNFPNQSFEGDVQQESTKSVVVNGTRAKSEICGKKPFSATPTDFSEAETSSSGFQDETSNKMTQTEGRPGSFLCSIADGEDCKLSIYDDNSPFESCKMLKYRQIFNQIFNVLERAAEAKDEGEKLPLSDISTTTTTVSQPQSTLVQEDLPSETADDTQSVVSSVVTSVVSEPPYRIKTLTSTNATAERQNNELSSRHEHANGKVDYNKHAYHLDYLNSNGHISKKSLKKHSNRRVVHNSDAPTTAPEVSSTTNSKIISTRSNNNGKKKFRPFNALEQNGTVCNDFGYINRSKESPRTGRRTNVYTRSNEHKDYNTFKFGDYKPSTASEEVARLKRLEMSYAEVLRLPNKSKTSNCRS